MADFETYAVVKIREPEVIGYMNLFEEGDYWEKIQGCEDCKEEYRSRCCSNCRIYVPNVGCGIHLGRSPQLKPHECVVKPVPDQGRIGCKHIYRCTKGSLKGKLRNVNKGLDELNA